MSRRKLTPEYRSTECVAGEKLKIPFFDMSLTDGRVKGRYQAESEVLRNSLLELLFEPGELASLTIVTGVETNKGKKREPVIATGSLKAEN